MYTVFVRDEQGNMKVVHDWRGGDAPHIMGDGELHVSPISGKWSMRTFLSFIRVVEYKRVA